MDMIHEQYDQKDVIIQAALEAFKELPVEGISYFHKRKKPASCYSWEYEFDI